MKILGREQQPFFIAEIGVNHNNDMDLAKRMVDTAIECGANAVKFQTFSAERLVSKGTPKVRYQEVSTPKEQDHFEMIKSLELSFDDHVRLKKYCDEKGIVFMSTPYSKYDAEFLESIDVEIYKTASADLIDTPLHTFIASTGKQAVVSVGMATLGEIEETMRIYEQAGSPSPVLLHCVSNYPCSDISINLNVLKTLSRAFDCTVGYSDHSEGNVACMLAYALGAKVFEKHFTLDKKMSGPDHKASAEPHEVQALIECLGRASVMLGSSVKSIQEEEKQMASVSRKSVTIQRELSPGDVVGPSDLTLKRPGTGLAPKVMSDLIGMRAVDRLKEDSQPSLRDFE